MTKGRIKDPRRVNDFWTQKARAENFPARSVFKLKEIDQKYGLLRKGARVLDLGCSPGSWTIYAATRVGPEGLVIGLDLNPPERVLGPPARFIQADVLEIEPSTVGETGTFDVILSDMAPKTTGAKSVDQARSERLARSALDWSVRLLRPGGALLVKVFQGPDVDRLILDLKAAFTTVRRVKPKSSRDISPEFFCLGVGFINDGANCKARILGPN
ncbi:MAG: RlmE family RNA methyltransferase [Pseudomonadota bacterium]